LKRVALAVAFGVATFAVVYGFAATMGLTSNQLGAGAASVTTCGDPDGFTIAGVDLDGSGRVTEVTVGGIPATCAGGQLTINLTKDDGTSIGAGGPVTVTSPSTSVTITGLPSLAEVAREVVIIVGP